MSFTLPKKFPLLPRRKNTDKSHYGHALIIAGSRGMTGAAILATRAAVRSGSGLTTLATAGSLGNITAKNVFEAMHLVLPETKEGAISLSAHAKIIQYIEKKKISAVALGPGLSIQPQTAALVRRLILNIKAPVVLDADGLNSFSAKGGSASGGKGYLQILRKHRCPLVLTPHRGEFERLFSKGLPKKEARRAKLAKKLSKFYDVVLVIKGPRTLVAWHDKVYINTTGNPGLAKGGAGDVLTGVIAAFLAQGLEPFEASSWAVYFHGKAADIAVKQKGELALIASDVIDCLPRAFSH